MRNARNRNRALEDHDFRTIEKSFTSGSEKLSADQRSCSSRVRQYVDETVYIHGQYPLSIRSARGSMISGTNAVDTECGGANAMTQLVRAACRTLPTIPR